MLQSAGIQVDAGLLQKEAVRLNEPFACHITTGRPLVVSKAGMSLDGRIATSVHPNSPGAEDAGARGIRIPIDTVDRARAGDADATGRRAGDAGARETGSTPHSDTVVSGR